MLLLPLQDDQRMRRFDEERPPGISFAVSGNFVSSVLTNATADSLASDNPENVGNVSGREDTDTYIDEVERKIFYLLG